VNANANDPRAYARRGHIRRSRSRSLTTFHQLSAACYGNRLTSRMTMNWAIATQANTSHFDGGLLIAMSLPPFLRLVQASIYTGTKVTR
jgi:hypothetical protein